MVDTAEIINKFKEEFSITIKEASVGMDAKNIFVHPKDGFDKELPMIYMDYNVYVGSYLPLENSKPPLRK